VCSLPEGAESNRLEGADTNRPEVADSNRPEVAHTSWPEGADTNRPEGADTNRPGYGHQAADTNQLECSRLLLLMMDTVRTIAQAAMALSLVRWSWK